MNKTYYIARQEYADAFYGSSSIVCVDYEELSNLAIGWGMELSELLDQVNEATSEDIALYGLSE